MSELLLRAPPSCFYHCSSKSPSKLGELFNVPLIYSRRQAPSCRRFWTINSPKPASSLLQANASVVSRGTGTTESDVLKALSQIIDPDFGTDIVSCEFIKDLDIDEAQGEVLFQNIDVMNLLFIFFGSG